MASEIDITKRKNKQKLLAELKVFLSSPLHTLFVETTQDQLTEVDSIILDPATITFGPIMELKGQKLVLTSNLTLFEDAAQTLEDRIQEMLDLENQTEPNEKLE